MAEEVGKICVKKSLIFHWEIPDLFCQLKKGLQFESPDFVFCDEEWCLAIFPQSSSGVPPFLNPMKLMLTKKKFSLTQHCVIYKVCLVEGDGREHMCIEGIQEFRGTDGSSEIYNFDTYSDVLRDRNKISPDGTLTISCTFICDHHALESKLISASKSIDENIEDMVNNLLEKVNGISTTEEEVIPDVIDSEKLLQDMEALFFSRKDSDVILIVQNQKFPVHRSILGARSSVFEAMFNRDTVETSSGEVTITDFEPGVFHDFLLYLYSAKVKRFSPENVIGLYSAAEKYDIQALKPKCVEFMKENLCVSMFCSAVSLALQHKESSLLEAATKFFVGNLKEIIVSVEWQAFLKENPVAANEFHIKASHFHVAPKGLA